jgi:DNA-binding MurR/RpiR family transcriptional regulator
MTTTGTKRGHKQELAIATLLTSPSIADAASAIGISEATLWRWLQDTDFQENYRAAKRQVLSQSISSLQNATSDAVRTLQDVMRDDGAPHSARNQAAKTILEFAFRGIEAEEVETRLAALEKAMEEDGA